MCGWGGIERFRVSLARVEGILPARSDFLCPETSASFLRTDFGAPWGACSQDKGEQPASSRGHGSEFAHQGTRHLEAAATAPGGFHTFIFFCLFLNCTSKLYPTCGGSLRGGRAGPHLGAEPVPPPAQPRQATRLCFKPVVEGRSTYRGRGEAWTVEGTGSVPPARAAAPRAAGLASPSLPKLQRHPRYGSPARMTAN